jgi:hypothetical protein
METGVDVHRLRAAYYTSTKIAGPVQNDSPISVLAGHDNRSYIDVNDHIYATSISSYILSNVQSSGGRCHTAQTKNQTKS